MRRQRDFVLPSLKYVHILERTEGKKRSAEETKSIKMHSTQSVRSLVSLPPSRALLRALEFRRLLGLRGFCIELMRHKIQNRVTFNALQFGS